MEEFFDQHHFHLNGTADSVFVKLSTSESAILTPSGRRSRRIASHDVENGMSLFVCAYMTRCVCVCVCLLHKEDMRETGNDMRETGRDISDKLCAGNNFGVTSGSLDDIIDATDTLPRESLPKITDRPTDSSKVKIKIIPEDSLDVLYSQATILQLKLLRYAVNHASVCGGKFADMSKGKEDAERPPG